MIDSQRLEALSQLDIESAEQNGLVDIGAVQIDQSLPASLRMLKYLDEIKNPYCFLCAGISVKIRFTPEGSTLEALLKNYFIALKQ